MASASRCAFNDGAFFIPPETFTGLAYLAVDGYWTYTIVRSHTFISKGGDFLDLDGAYYAMNLELQRLDCEGVIPS